MQSVSRLLFLLVLVVILGISCANPNDNNAKSINVDSTNINGTAPVRYSPADPADTTSRLPVADDTGRRANTEPK